jgi:hypothetical protein
MKYELMLRSRANPSEPYEEKHARFFARLRQMPHSWGMAGQEAPPCPKMGSRELDGVRFGKLLGKGIRAQVCYLFRHSGLSKDLGMNDDFVDLSFNPEKVDYRQLVHEALPVYIEAFHGYMAQLKDDAFFEGDFPKEREMKLDDRHGVYRVHLVSYFDRLLCQRAFNLTPEEIADRLSGRIEEVRLIHDGVYLIGSSEPLELAAADRLTQEMKRWIVGG